MKHQAVLEVQGLSKSFGAVRACYDLSFSVETGSIHALIGPNGAGKTTVIKQLSGETLPDLGQIYFNGQDISGLPMHKRARLGLGRSFQITSVFENLSVQENVALALQAHDGHSFRFWVPVSQEVSLQKASVRILERIGLTKRAGEPAHSLSYGEKSQLEVGMALAGEPKLLLLDEPMAGMGPGGTAKMIELIRQLKGEVSILLIEHDMQAVFALADQITVLVYGEKVVTGTPDEIRASDEVKRAYLGDGDI